MSWSTDRWRREQMPVVDDCVSLAEAIAHARVNWWRPDELRERAIDIEPRLERLPVEAFAEAVKPPAPRSRVKRSAYWQGALSRAARLLVQCGAYDGKPRTLASNAVNRRAGRRGRLQPQPEEAY